MTYQRGDVAKWQGKGLQNPDRGFESRRRLSSPFSLQPELSSSLCGGYKFKSCTAHVKDGSIESASPGQQKALRQDTAGLFVGPNPSEVSREPNNLGKVMRLV
jgi:hypothetical protein